MGTGMGTGMGTDAGAGAGMLTSTRALVQKAGAHERARGRLGRVRAQRGAGPAGPGRRKGPAA